MASPFDGLDPNSPEFQELLAKAGQGSIGDNRPSPYDVGKSLLNADSGSAMDALFGKKGSYQNGKLVPPQDDAHSSDDGQQSAIDGDPFDVEGLFAKLKGGASQQDAAPVDADQSDALGVRTTLERMLGRHLSPEALSQLSSQKDDNGVPYYLSKERNPNQDETSLEDNDSDDGGNQKDPSSGGNSRKPTSVASPEQADSPEKTEKEAPARQFLDFGQSGNANALEKALAAQKQAIQDSRFQRGVEQLSGGIAGITPDNTQSDMMQKSASSPIQEYLLRNKEAANDPNSGLSKGLRAYMSKLGMDVSDGATATQLQQVMPYIFKDKEAAQAQKARHEDQAERLAERKEEAHYRNEVLKLQKQQSSDMRHQARQDKLDHYTDQATKDAVTMLETARGSKDVQNAKEAIRTVDNATSLLNEYPDLNKMPQTQVALYTQELGKIAKGGVSGAEEFREIMPKSAASYIENKLSQLGNHPTGAQLGKFLQETRPYLDAIKNNSVTLVNSRNERILDASRKRLGEENYNILKNTYNHPHPSDQKPQGTGLQIQPAPDWSTGAQAELAKRLGNKGQ